MVVNGVTAKRHRSNTEKDRLSSLHDDILIGILSNLPLQLAIDVGSLSRRWRGLWKNVTSIDITYNHRKSECLSDFFSKFNPLMMQFTSPFIHNFSVELLGLEESPSKQPGDYSWLHHICHRNVRKLKLTWPKYGGRYVLTEVPSVIFQTQSLVSIDLDSTFDWRLPNDIINLPNLKNLSLASYSREFESVEKLVEACPSLEELSLTYRACASSNHHVKCSNQNLRRLALNLNYCQSGKLVINAPKLEYLRVYTSKLDAFLLDMAPTVLREVNIDISRHVDFLSSDESKHIRNFLEAICKVRILSLEVFALDNVSTVFHNAVWVTINMKTCHDIQRVLLLLKWCPQLEFLTLKFSDMSEEIRHQFLQEHVNLSMLLPLIKRIEIVTDWYHYHNPTKSILKLVDYLLGYTIGLEHFRFRIEDDTDCKRRSPRRQIASELKFCKLLYQCPTVSPDCEVEFVGNILRMSRKAGPKVWRENGEVIPFSCSPWDGFKF